MTAEEFVTITTKTKGVFIRVIADTYLNKAEFDRITQSYVDAWENGETCIYDDMMTAFGNNARTGKYTDEEELAAFVNEYCNLIVGKCYEKAMLRMTRNDAQALTSAVDVIGKYDPSGTIFFFGQMRTYGEVAEKWNELHPDDEKIFPSIDD